jgi:hypothetical protein
MAFVPDTNIAATATSSGLADFTLSPTNPAGLFTPENAGVIDGKSYTYCAVGPDGIVFEAGDGAYSVSTHTMARTNIRVTSNDDQVKVSFTGPPTVYFFPAPPTTIENGQFQPGTQMLFANAAAPLGWTRITTFNDCAIRIVGTATPSSGGTNAFSTVMAQTVVGSTTLTTTTMPVHDHSYGEPGGAVDVEHFTSVPVNVSSTPGSANTGSNGSGGSHNHTILMSIKYVDFLFASKN